MKEKDIKAYCEQCKKYGNCILQMMKKESSCAVIKEYEIFNKKDLLINKELR